MSSIREFFTVWKIDTSSAEHNLHKIEEQLEAVKGKMELLTTIEVGKGLFELVEKFSASAESLHLAAESAGLTVEELQKLTYAGKQAGVSAEGIETAMFRLSHALYEARKGTGPAIQGFSKLGIGPDQIRGFKTAEDALFAISGRMQNIKDPIEKSAIAMQFMGRGSRDMVGWLSQGPDAIKKNMEAVEGFGGVLREDQVHALVEVEHALGRFWALLKGVAGTIAANVAPALENLIEDFFEFFQANRKLIEANIENWLHNVAYGFGFLAGLVIGLTEQFIKLADYLGIPKEKLLAWVATAVGVISTILLVGTVFAGLSTILGGFASAFSAVGTVFGFVATSGGALWTVLKFLWAIIPDLAFVTEVFWAAWGIGGSILAGVGTALSAIGSVLAAIGGALISVPALIIAAILAVIVVIHDLWVLLRGGDIKDTWIGQAYEWISGLVSKIGELIESFKILDKVKSGFNGVKSFFGFGSDENKTEGGNAVTGSSAALNPAGTGILMDLAKGGEPSGLPPGTIPDLTGGNTTHIGGEQNVTVSSPMTFNFAAGTSQQHVDQVSAGIKENFGSVLREAQRSLKPAVAR